MRRTGAERPGKHGLRLGDVVRLKCTHSACTIHPKKKPATHTPRMQKNKTSICLQVFPLHICINMGHYLYTFVYTIFIRPIEHTLIRYKTPPYKYIVISHLSEDAKKMRQSKVHASEWGSVVFRWMPHSYTHVSVGGENKPRKKSKPNHFDFRLSAITNIVISRPHPSSFLFLFFVRLSCLLCSPCSSPYAHGHTHTCPSIVGELCLVGLRRQSLTPITVNSPNIQAMFALVLLGLHFVWVRESLW